MQGMSGPTCRESTSGLDSFTEKPTGTAGLPCRDSPAAPQWKGAEHFVVNGAGKGTTPCTTRTDNDDTYLALGYWAWAPGPRINRRPFVGAAARNDPFQAGIGGHRPGNIRRRGDGPLCGSWRPCHVPEFWRRCQADRRLRCWIGGLLLDGRDSASDEPLFEELTLGNAAIQTRPFSRRGQRPPRRHLGRAGSVSTHQGVSALGSVSYHA